MKHTVKPARTDQHTEDTTTPLGFWIYLMTDCLLFASLFATYGVLRNNTAGGVTGADIFDISSVLVQTLLLLTSSLTAGVALLMVRNRRKQPALLLLGITMMLGMGFLIMELQEFGLLLSEGHGWQTSAFLSSFFTLVGTHGVHITVGLLWAAILFILIIRRGIDTDVSKKMLLFTQFWHFLDVVWIFIFTFVYSIGVLL